MITVDEHNGSRVAIVEYEPDKIIIYDEQSALDLMADIWHNYACDKILIDKLNICEDFFKLQTGLAGTILQKYTTYGVKFATFGDFYKYRRKSLNDFIHESNRGTQVFFLSTKKDALEKLHATK